MWCVGFGFAQSFIFMIRLVGWDKHKISFSILGYIKIGLDMMTTFFLKGVTWLSQIKAPIFASSFLPFIIDLEKVETHCKSLVLHLLPLQRGKKKRLSIRTIDRIITTTRTSFDTFAVKFWQLTSILSFSNFFSFQN